MLNAIDYPVPAVIEHSNQTEVGEIEPVSEETEKIRSEPGTGWSNASVNESESKKSGFPKWFRQ